MRSVPIDREGGRRDTDRPLVIHEAQMPGARFNEIRSLKRRVKENDDIEDEDLKTRLGLGNLRQVYSRVASKNVPVDDEEEEDL